MNIYDILINVWKRERSEAILQPLEIDFFQRCREYMNHLDQQAEDETNGLLQNLFRKRGSRTNYLINDLINIRTQKIMDSLISGDRVTKKLAEEEQDLRKHLEQDIANYRNKILGINSTIDHHDLHNDENYQMIKFKENEGIQSLGSDLKIYGPFQKGDIAIVPSDNAKNFFKRSKADLIEIDSN